MQAREVLKATNGTQMQAEHGAWRCGWHGGSRTRETRHAPNILTAVLILSDASDLGSISAESSHRSLFSQPQVKVLNDLLDSSCYYHEKHYLRNPPFQLSILGQSPCGLPLPPLLPHHAPSSNFPPLLRLSPPPCPLRRRLL